MRLEFVGMPRRLVSGLGLRRDKQNRSRLAVCCTGPLDDALPGLWVLKRVAPIGRGVFVLGSVRSLAVESWLVQLVTEGCDCSLRTIFPL